MNVADFERFLAGNERRIELLEGKVVAGNTLQGSRALLELLLGS